MRKRKNKESIDEINQGLLIKQKKLQIVHPETEPKNKRKTKSKGKN